MHQILLRRQEVAARRPDVSVEGDLFGIDELAQMEEAGRRGWAGDVGVAVEVVDGGWWGVEGVGCVG